MKVCSIFSQVLKLFSRGGFEKAVKQHKAERHARGFTSWGQFIAMLFCQVGRAHSLREICGGLACCEGQLKHLGVRMQPAFGREAAPIFSPVKLAHPMNRLVGANCLLKGALRRRILRAVGSAVMEQSEEIASDHLLRAMSRDLQQGIVAERYIPLRIQTAEALHDGVQDQLQFPLQLLLGAFQ